MGSDVGAVAKIVVNATRGESARRGSGYRIATGVVLTSAHVVAGREQVSVRFHSGVTDGEWEVGATVSLLAEDIDLAVLELQLGPDQVKGTVPAVRFGRIPESGPPVGVNVIGFPWFKLRERDGPHEYRDTHAPWGKVNPASNWVEGTLEISVDTTPVGESGESPWGGFSGAAVFSGNLLVGIVTEHHYHEGNMLTARRVDRWYRTDPALLARIRKLTGLPASAEELATASAGETDPRDATRRRGEEVLQTAERHDYEPLPLRRTLPGNEALRLGRDGDLAALEKRLRKGQHVIVQGPPGIGKKHLLDQAAFAGILAAATVPGCTGVIRLGGIHTTAHDVIQALLRECYRVDHDNPVPLSTAKRLLDGIRALVVLDEVDLRPDELRSVLRAMPDSVFVLTTTREDLRSVAGQLSLSRLSPEDSLNLFESEFEDKQYELFDPDKIQRALQARDGNPGKLLQFAESLKMDTVPEKPSIEDLRVIVPRLIDTLQDPARNALRILSAFADIDWGVELLCAAGIEQSGADQLCDKRLASKDHNGYRVDRDTSAQVPLKDKLADSELSGLVGRIAVWVAGSTPDLVAGEARVIERALRLALGAEQHDAALELALAASAKVMASWHWGAWGRVLVLGLEAANQAESVGAQVFFRHALLVRKLSDEKNEKAVELLIAATNLRSDEDQDLAGPAIQNLAAEQPLTSSSSLMARAGDVLAVPLASIAAKVKATREAAQQASAKVILRLASSPRFGPVVRLIEQHPAIAKGVGSIAAVAALVLATVAGFGGPGEPAAEPPPSASPSTAMTDGPEDLGSGPGTGGQEDPSSASPSPSGSSNGGQAGAAPDGGVGSSPGGGTGGREGGTSLGGITGSTVTPPPPFATWGFARVWNVGEPIGSTRPLAGPGAPNNNEANWTYGPWAMTSPAVGYPTATHVAPGVQRIRMPGVGALGGMVKVTTQDYAAWAGAGPAGYQPGVFCQPLTWGPDGDDELIDVVCFDKTGNRADIPFLALYVNGSGPNSLSAGGAHGYVVDDQPAAATFTPDWARGLNAGVVRRTGDGRYTADLPGSAGGVVEVSAVGSTPRHCSIAGRHGERADITCVTPNGTPADTMFTAAYATGQNMLDDRRKPVGDYLLSANSAGGPSITGQWASGNGGVTLERLSTGKYKAHFTNGYIPSTMHVTATGEGAHCSVMLWNDYSYKDDTSVWVACLDMSGTPTDSGFDLLYSSTRIY